MQKQREVLNQADRFGRNELYGCPKAPWMRKNGGRQLHFLQSVKQGFRERTIPDRICGAGRILMVHRACAQAVSRAEPCDGMSVVAHDNLVQITYTGTGKTSSNAVTILPSPLQRDQKSGALGLTEPGGKGFRFAWIDAYYRTTGTG